MCLRASGEDVGLDATVIYGGESVCKGRGLFGGWLVWWFAGMLAYLMGCEIAVLQACWLAG